MDAVENNDLDWLRYLVENGASLPNVYAKGTGFPLHTAAYYGYSLVAALIINWGVQVSVCFMSRFCEVHDIKTLESTLPAPFDP